MQYKINKTLRNMLYPFRKLVEKFVNVTDKTNETILFKAACLTAAEAVEGDYFEYANSIILSRNGKLKESLILLNKLIYKYSDNSYLLETKGDLLLNHGYLNEAKGFYQIVLSKNSENKYAKKRLFEIKYNQINKINKSNYAKFFDNFSDLLDVFPNNMILHKKFKELALFSNKYSWLNFIEANILIINNHNDDALKKLDNILIISNDNKLINYTKKRIKHISNE